MIEQDALEVRCPPRGTDVMRAVRKRHRCDPIYLLLRGRCQSSKFRVCGSGLAFDAVDERRDRSQAPEVLRNQFLGRNSHLEVLF